MAIKRSEVGNPAGAEPFDSGFMRPGGNFSKQVVLRTDQPRHLDEDLKTKSLFGLRIV